MYWFTDTGLPGCEGYASSGQTYRTDIPPGATKVPGYGSGVKNWCSTLGEAQFVTTIYNASHLDYDTLGDPAVDEPLARGILKFNIVP